MEEQTSFNAHIKKKNQDILIMQFKNILKNMETVLLLLFDS